MANNLNKNNMEFIQLNVIKKNGGITKTLVRKEHIMSIAEDNEQIKVLIYLGAEFDVETLWCKNDYHAIARQLNQ